jgi:ADP-ribose pyrophosphatase
MSGASRGGITRPPGRDPRLPRETGIRLCYVNLILNATAAVGGLLAAARARDDGWATLRPADSPPI